MNIVIIGNGIAGITAARYIRKMSREHRVTVISPESDHFFSRCALMYVYMGKTRYKDIKPYEDHFWKKNRIDLINDKVVNINIEKGSVALASGKALPYDKLLIATGSKWNKLNVPGGELKGVHGFYSLQDLEEITKQTRHIKKGVVIGGGLIGIELCEMLHAQEIDVSFLVREQYYYENVISEAEGRMINGHIKKHGVDVRFDTQVREILGDEDGKVRAIITSSGETIETEFVGLGVGVHPNVELAKKSGIGTDAGILIDEYMETSVENIFAAGDCAQHRIPPVGRKPVEQFWYTGRLQGQAAAFNICGRKEAYQPGVFYNSAKFFDIEYQVYGTVPAKPTEGFDEICWEHPEKEKLIKITFDKDTMEVKGFSLLGIRYRHQICDQWIREKQHMDHVMQHLKAANFDPEFYKTYEDKLIGIYNKKYNKNIKPKRKRKMWDLIFRK